MLDLVPLHMSFLCAPKREMVWIDLKLIGKDLTRLLLEPSVHS
jgi:hypothetical protein